jgi:alpha-tubulin suppressor-like RCC1 family protein
LLLDRPADADEAAAELPPDEPPAVVTKLRAPAAAIGDVLDVEVGSPIYGHAGCVLKRDGSVACWAGPNILTHFGRGRTEPVPGPWKVAGLPDAVALFKTVNGHCAVRKNGSGLCWSGQQQTPIALDKLVAITGSGDYLCALRNDRTVHCRGSNSNGEIGRAPVRSGAPGGVSKGDWAAVAGATDVVAIADTCAVRANGGLVCWGAHALRPAPSGTDIKSALATFEPQLVRGIPKVIGIALAAKHTCLLTTTGTVQCTPDDEPIKWQTLDIRGVDELVAGMGGIVARTRAGAVHYWGPGPSRNEVDGADWAKRERAAFGTSKLRPVPNMVGTINVSATNSHVCATTAAHRVLCWGHNEYGQLGNGTLAENATTYVVDYHPALLAGPGEQEFGCKPTTAIRRSCPKLGPTCALEPPPGYWNWGGGGGARCDEDCMRRAGNELGQRAIPACMCTCSDDYKKADAVENQKRMQPPPPSTRQRRWGRGLRQRSPSVTAR